MDDLEKIKEFLTDIEEKNIVFSNHFIRRSWERPVSEEKIRSAIHKIENLSFCEKQYARNINEEKYKLWFRLSGKYYLVLIATISEKSLYIVTAWVKNRK